MSQAGEGGRLTVSEFARRADCDRTQVRRAIAKGLISQGEDGLLSESDVAGQWRKPNRRTVVKRATDRGGTTAKKPGTTRTVPPKTRRGETVAEAAERLVAEQPLLSFDQALKLKENYLGRLKQLEYDLKAGTVHVSATCAKAVGGEYARVRTRVLAIPSEQAPALFRCQSVAEIEDKLREVLVEALEALTFDQDPGTG